MDVLRRWWAALLLAVVLLPCRAYAGQEGQIFHQGELLYRLEDGGVTICQYVGEARTIEVPGSMAGYPVSKIAAGAFDGVAQDSTVLLPDTIMEIEDGAFPAGVTVYRRTDEAQQPPREEETGGSQIAQPAQETPAAAGEQVPPAQQSPVVSVRDETLSPSGEHEVITDPAPDDWGTGPVEGQEGTTALPWVAVAAAAAVAAGAVGVAVLLRRRKRP